MESRNDTWTVGRTLAWMSERFASASETARLDAQVLLGHATGLSRVELYTQFEKPLTLPERETLRGLVRRRLAGEPVAYIVGHKEWLDLDLIVDERVLIPRPETETLFDLAARWLESESLAPEVLERFWIVDVCTGSGCLALALSRRFPEIPVTGVDISKDALEVSMINASRLETTVEWLEGDVMDTGFWDDCRSALRARAPRGVLLVGNPPYVSEAEYLACEQGVREFEPRLALVAAEDGLAVVRGLTQMWLTLAAENPHTEFFLALEAAAGHPRSVIGSSSEHPLVSHAPAQISAREEASAFPRQGLFIGEDLDGKDRFLLGRSSAVPRSLH